jgi:DUF1365 family protein
MNSCLYECEVMHHRLAPKEHRFSYSIFMFYIDLDEIELLHQKNLLFSRNRFNWFSLRDNDHLQFSKPNEKSIKENIIEYLASQHIELEGGKIMLLTNVATLGYTFNPISIYLCFDAEQKPVCAVAEVNNTHDEMKLYVLSGDHLHQQTFRRLVAKYFYVSPFADLDSSFEFIFTIPDETVNMRVDDYQHGKRFLLSSLKGKRKVFKDSNLLWYGLRFPFVTIKIITLIYWQALLLMIKGIPHQKKNFNPHMQRDLYSTKKM